MNLKSNFSKALAVAGLAAGVMAATPAIAGFKGAMNLDLTNGCFATSTDQCGARPEQTPGGLQSMAYATGQFHLTDTLLSVYGGTAGLSTQPFSYTGVVDMNAGSTELNVTNFFDAAMAWPNYTALSSDPIMQFGFGLLQAITLQGNNGVLPLDPSHTVFYALTGVTGSQADNMGSFAAWSFNNFNDVSQALFGQDLPADAYFNIHVNLTAIPEPASMALVGLGLLGLGAMCRRKVVA